MTHFEKLLFVAGVTFKTGSHTRVFFCQFCEIFQSSFGCELLLLILHNTLLSLSIKFDFFATDFEKKIILLNYLCSLSLANMSLVFVDWFEQTSVVVPSSGILEVKNRKSNYVFNKQLKFDLSPQSYLVNLKAEKLPFSGIP